MSLKKKVRHFRKKLHWTVQNRVASQRIQRELSSLKTPISDLTRYERRISSQNGEDGMLEAIFTVLEPKNRFFVEFGVEDGSQCNTNWLAKKKAWRGLMMDCKAGISPAGIPIREEFVTAEIVEELFRKYSVPTEFDLLSIDIDGNDYWVWKAITHYNPQVVVMEYNANIPPNESRTISYDASFRWAGTDYFGASLLALKKLGEQKGYSLVACDSSGTNAFFVQTALVPGRFLLRPIEEIYRPPACNEGRGHPKDKTRQLIQV